MILDYDLICDLQIELRRARDLFPTNQLQLAATVEEIGEVANALIDQSRGKKSHEDVYKECIQLAAMALRIASEGDAQFPSYHPESGYRGRAWPGYSSGIDARKVTIE